MAGAGGARPLPVVGVADVTIVPSQASAKVLAGGFFWGTFKVRNDGPDKARGIHVVFTFPPGLTNLRVDSFRGTCAGFNCRVNDLDPGGEGTVYFDATLPNTAGRVVVNASVTTATDDPDVSNNSADAVFDAVLAPNLQLVLGAYDTSPNPGDPSSVALDIYSRGNVPATNVVVTVTLPDELEVTSQSGDPSFACDFRSKPLTCRAASLPVALYSEYRLNLHYRNPPVGGVFRIRARCESDQADFIPSDNDGEIGIYVDQYFDVTATDDAGPGSLRQAIFDANATCAKRCFITFRIPGPLPESGFFTIGPQTPLPALNFVGAVLGGTEREMFTAGTTPLIMLDGSQQKPDGDGLVINTQTDVSDLAIGNFPRYGIFTERIPPSFAASYRTVIDHVYLGVDPTGRIAAPNLRGLVDSVGGVELKNSVISGNRRSGIVSAGGGAWIHDCRIGVAADSASPIPNGASGIYAPGTGSLTVTGSVIANHPDFAIALDATQHFVSISKNSIYDNNNGIDYGLDGPSPNGSDSASVPNHPTIESARYDPVTKRTVIEVRLETSPRPALTSLPLDLTIAEADVEVYANHGAKGQAERLVGTLNMGSLLDLEIKFATLTVDGDLRGQTITAVSQRMRQDCSFYYLEGCTNRFYETSEISPPVAVK